MFRTFNNCPLRARSTSNMSTASCVFRGASRFRGAGLRQRVADLRFGRADVGVTDHAIGVHVIAEIG
jgi:hypothetical protein